MSDKTVVELKAEAKLKKIKGFSKMNRDELCKVLGYENCGKRVSVKKTKQAKKTSPKKVTPKKNQAKNKVTPKKAQMKAQNKPVKKMVDAHVYTFDLEDRGEFYSDMERFLTDLAVYVKNDKAKGKYYFHSDIDSDTTTEFDILSNNQLLGVQAENKEKGLILLWLLELLYDYQRYMKEDYPFWNKPRWDRRKFKTESKHIFAREHVFALKHLVYFANNKELDLEENGNSATGAEFIDAIVSGRKDYVKTKVKGAADIWTGERIYKEMKKLKII